MGTSFTEYKGHGFWASDACLEVWLYLLANEITRSQESIPGWLDRARQEWLTQATVGFGGWISAGLDELVGDEAGVDAVVHLAEQALVRLGRRGAVLSQAELNALGTGGSGSRFTRDVETWKFEVIGRAFIALLRGQISTDAATSSVYPCAPDDFNPNAA